MNRSRRPWLEGASASATGWISMSDVFLLCTVFMAAAVLGLDVARRGAMQREEEEKARAAGLEEQLQKAESAEARAREEGKRERDAHGTRSRRLTREAEELRARVVWLERLLLEIEEAASKAALRTKSLLAERNASIAELRSLMVALTDELDGVRAELAEMRAFAAAEQEREKKRRLSEGKLRKELLAIEGELRRVIFVFDRSGSMKQGDRWKQALKTATDWVESLPVEEAALITFNERPVAYPEDGTLLDMNKPANRKDLRSELAEVEPDGQTDTLRALKKAFTYANIDAIVLLTDGRPTVSELGGKEEDFIPQVINFVQVQEDGRSEVRIHTIGLADYFGSDYGRLLLRISEMTGGTFIGR